MSAEPRSLVGQQFVDAGGPTSAHEHMFLLSKRPTYFYDQDAIREPHSREWWTEPIPERRLTDDLRPRPKGGWGDGGQRYGNGDPSGRNRRNVWEVVSEPFPGAHFAVFGTKWIEPCILAGSSPKACGECGAPWERVARTEIDDSRPRARQNIIAPKVTQNGDGTNSQGSQTWGHWTRRVTEGWQPTCAHDDDTDHSVILDPFAGAGTTGLVALRHDRSFIGIELSPAYAEMARERIRNDQPLFNWQNEIAEAKG